MYIATQNFFALTLTSYSAFKIQKICLHRAIIFVSKHLSFIIVVSILFKTHYAVTGIAAIVRT